MKSNQGWENQSIFLKHWIEIKLKHDKLKIKKKKQSINWNSTELKKKLGRFPMSILSENKYKTCIYYHILRLKKMIEKC